MTDKKADEELQPQVVEEVNIRHIKNAGIPDRKTYRVTTETGLFKNGTQYNQGDQIELDELTAANFKELGEVEDV